MSWRSYTINAESASLSHGRPLPPNDENSCARLQNVRGDSCCRKSGSGYQATDAANVRIREFLQEPAASTLDVTLPPPAGSLFSLFRGAGTLCLALGLLLFVGLARDRSEKAGAGRGSPW